MVRLGGGQSPKMIKTYNELIERVNVVHCFVLSYSCTFSIVVESSLTCAHVCLVFGFMWGKLVQTLCLSL